MPKTNLFYVASGAWGFDGADDGHGIAKLWKWPARMLGYFDPEMFVVISKTYTRHPRAGNLRFWKPWKAVRYLGGGNFVNSVGLTNPGIDAYQNNIWTKPPGTRLIPSIWVESLEDAEYMLPHVKHSPYGVELNCSCPNANHDNTVEFIGNIVRYLSTRLWCRLILKLGYTDPYIDIIKHVGGYLGAVDFINAVLWHTVHDQTTKSPLNCYGYDGGVSGPMISSMAKEVLCKVRAVTQTVPIISGGGVYADSVDACVQEFTERFQLGADAISIGTLFLRHPTLPYRAVKKWLDTNNKYIKETRHQWEWPRRIIY